MAAQEWVLPVLLSFMFLVAYGVIVLHFRFVESWSYTDYDVPVHHHWMTSTSKVSAFNLMLYRILVFTLSMGVLLHTYMARTHFYTFYTIWNFTLLTAYFGVASWSSISAWNQGFTHGAAENRSSMSSAGSIDEPLTAPSRYEGEGVDFDLTGQSEMADGEDVSAPHASPRRATIQMMMLEVEMASALLVTTVTWSVLLPQALKVGEEAHLLNFTSYVMHICNVALLLPELLLNRLPYHTHHFYLTVVWVLAYGLFEQAVHGLGLSWPYFFLATGSPAALVWYPSMLVAHTLFHCVASILANRLKRYLVGHHFTPGLPGPAETRAGGGDEGYESPLLGQ